MNAYLLYQSCIARGGVTPCWLWSQPSLNLYLVLSSTRHPPSLGLSFCVWTRGLTTLFFFFEYQMVNEETWVIS